MIPTSKVVCTWGEWVNQKPPPFKILKAGGPMTSSSQNIQDGMPAWDSVQAWSSFAGEFNELFKELRETKFAFEPLPTWTDEDIELYQRTERGIEYLFTYWHIHVIKQATRVLCEQFSLESLLQSSASGRWPSQISLGPDAVAPDDTGSGPKPTKSGASKRTKNASSNEKARKSYPDWAVTTSETHELQIRGRNIFPGETKRVAFSLEDAINMLNVSSKYLREPRASSSSYISPPSDPRGTSMWAMKAICQGERYAFEREVRMFFLLTNERLGVFRRTLGPGPSTPTQHQLRPRPDPQSSPTAHRSKKVAVDMRASPSPNPMLSSSPHPPSSDYEPDNDELWRIDDGPPQYVTAEWNHIRTIQDPNRVSLCELLAGSILMAVDLQRRGENIAKEDKGYQSLLVDFHELHEALKQLRRKQA